MTRSLRIEYADAIYHVYFRGHNRQDIFLNDDDRQFFIDRLRQTRNRYGWRIFTFTQMTNHAHQLFQTPEPNLCAGMQYLLSAFAARVNRRHGFEGSLLQGRYGAKVVEDESYYWTVSRYNHLNPMLASTPLVEKLEDWKWSTYPGYFDPQQRLDWVDYDAVYAAWSGTFGGDPCSAYRAYVERGIVEPPVDPFVNAIDGWILGSERFVEWLKEKIDFSQSSADVPQLRRFLTVELEELLQRVSEHYKLPISYIIRRGSRHISRAVFAWLSRRYTRATRRQLARRLNLRHPESVTTLLRKVESLRATDLDLQFDIQLLETSLIDVETQRAVRL